MTFTLLISSILLVALYVGATIWVHKRLPDSVSAMVYNLPKGGKYLWTLWIWSVTLLFCPTLFDVIGEDCGILAHCFATSLMFTGAMPLVQGERNKAHNMLGVTAGVFSQMCVCIIDVQWLASWMLFVFFMGSVYVQPQGNLGKAVKGKGVFVAEAICWLSVMGSLIFK